MAVFLHFAPAVAMAVVAGPRALPVRAMVAGVLCAILPDADFLLVHAGIGTYGSPWGHRGFTHSLGFALILAMMAMTWPASVLGRQTWRATVDAEGSLRRRLLVGAYVFVSTASHPLLDNLLDVAICPAWLWPLDSTRVCIPWRPVPMRGLGMFSLEWLWTELRYVGLPLLVVAASGALARRLFNRHKSGAALDHHGVNEYSNAPDDSHGVLVDGIVARMRLHGVEAGDSDLLEVEVRETARTRRARRRQAVASMAEALWQIPRSGASVRQG